MSPPRASAASVKREALAHVAVSARTRDAEPAPRSRLSVALCVRARLAQTKESSYSRYTLRRGTQEDLQLGLEGDVEPLLAPVHASATALAVARRVAEEDDRAGDLREASDAVRQIERLGNGEREREREKRRTSSRYLLLNGAGMLNSTDTWSLLAPPSELRMR